jgi:hypothetical protein
VDPLTEPDGLGQARPVVDVLNQRTHKGLVEVKKGAATLCAYAFLLICRDFMCADKYPPKWPPPRKMTTPTRNANILPLGDREIPMAAF